MEKKLEKTGKKCSYKNYDLLSTKVGIPLNVHIQYLIVHELLCMLLSCGDYFEIKRFICIQMLNFLSVFLLYILISLHVSRVFEYSASSQLYRVLCYFCRCSIVFNGTVIWVLCLWIMVMFAFDLTALYAWYFRFSFLVFFWVPLSLIILRWKFVSSHVWE